MKRKVILNIANKAGRFYRPFDRKKFGTDKWRHIDNPTDILKIIQKRIHTNILSRIELPQTMTGGIKKRSTKDNASFHVRKKEVISLDIKDCFPRTSYKKIFSVFKNGLGCSDIIASNLTKLTTFQTRLPQGAPTSPTLANISLLPLHNEILELCSRNGLDLSFFIDDITFSGADGKDLIGPIVNIVQKHNYAVSNKKIKIMPSGARQEITGITVNKKISISRKKIEKIRNRILDLGYGKKLIIQGELASIRGKIEYVKNICPVAGISLENLAEKILPVVTIVGIKCFEKDLIRPCRRARRHKKIYRKDAFKERPVVLKSKR